MVRFATEACLQVSVFISVWDWKKSGMLFVKCNIHLFKVSVSLPSMAIYFVCFINKSKFWWTPLLSENQVVPSVCMWSDMLGKAEHHCHLLDFQWKQWVHHTCQHAWLLCSGNAFWLQSPLCLKQRWISYQLGWTSKWWLCFIPPGALKSRLKFQAQKETPTFLSGCGPFCYSGEFAAPIAVIYLHLSLQKMLIYFGISQSPKKPSTC